MHRQWYLHDTILWRFFLSPLWPTIGLSHSTFQMDSLNLPCGTYTQLCLHLNNPSTNLTSLSTLLLRSSPKTFCALGYLIYPSRILPHKFPSPAYISHKVWMVLIAWNFSRLLSASGTTFPWSDLWIKSDFISAKLSCHRSHLALNCACMSKYI